MVTRAEEHRERLEVMELLDRAAWPLWELRGWSCNGGAGVTRGVSSNEEFERNAVQLINVVQLDVLLDSSSSMLKDMFCWAVEVQVDAVIRVHAVRPRRMRSKAVVWSSRNSDMGRTAWLDCVSILESIK